METIAPRALRVLPVQRFLLALGVALLCSTAAHAKGTGGASKEAVETKADTPSHAESLAALYERQEGVLWTRPAGLSEAGEAAIRWLRDAPFHGVSDFEGRLSEFDAFLAVLVPHAGPAAQGPGLRVVSSEVAQQLRTGGVDESPKGIRLRLEAGIALALADLFAELTHRPRVESILRDENGRYSTPDSLWRGIESRLDAAALGELMAAASDVQSLETWMKGRLPSASQYAKLLEASRTYSALCEEGGWEPLPVTRYRRGLKWKNKEAIEALQARLALEGFHKGEVNGIYDEVMLRSVKAYQAARQLKASGRYDRETSEELNIPCEARLKTIQLNLRRWRQTARTSESTFVEANLASQEVRYVDEGEERMRKRTVVGSGRWFWSRKHKQRIYPKKSPLLTDAIEKIIVNPSWTIPGSIVKQEILPRVEKDETYLERKGYIIKKSKNGHDIYVQPPGKNNTLGEVKLIFPNAEAIYLHDTNNRYLFRTPRRAMSHGCIRVQDALDFATALMTDEHRRQDKHFNPKALHRLSRRDKTVVFKLDQPVPVFLEYYTASVGPEGMVRFHPDVYEYDLQVDYGGMLPRRLPKALRR